MKITYFFIGALILVCLLSKFSTTSGHNIYPLEKNEKIINTREINKNVIEIFTELDDKVYLKRLNKNMNKWNIVKSKPIKKRYTGFNYKESNLQGDRELTKAIREEIYDYGNQIGTIPSKIDHSETQLLPPVGMQNDYSCVGWATAYYVRTFQQAKDIGWKIKDGEDIIRNRVFSPSFIYNQINNGVDKGSNIYDAAELLKDVGAGSLESFPYEWGDYISKPDEKTIEDAYEHRISHWRRLYTNLDSEDFVIQSIKEYLNTGDLVVVGSKIGYNFLEPYMNQNSESIITYENYNPYLHAYVIVGYDDGLETFDGKGAFKLINSWGKDWGNEGFSYISYEAISKNSLEGYVFTDLINIVEEKLPIEVNNRVDFEVTLSGKGVYDYQILNMDNQLIYNKNNITADEGINSIKWYGRNNNGVLMSDEIFRLDIIPYKNQTAKNPYQTFFRKTSKISDISCSVYKYNEDMQKIELSMFANNDAKISINAKYNNEIQNIISDLDIGKMKMNKIIISYDIKLKMGYSENMIVSNVGFDFNNINFSDLKLMVDVK